MKKENIIEKSLSPSSRQKINKTFLILFLTAHSRLFDGYAKRTTMNGERIINLFMPVCLTASAKIRITKKYLKLGFSLLTDEGNVKVINFPFFLPSQYSHESRLGVCVYINSRKVSNWE